MNPKALGLAVLIIIACVVSPTFSGILFGAIGTLLQIAAVAILTYGLILLIINILFGKIRIKSQGKTYEY